MSKLKFAAKNYAAKGWQVLPLHWAVAGKCSCGKDNCTSIGKHPIGELVENGVNGSTSSLTLIDEWWKRYPQANVGVATGSKSNVVVLDVDPRNGGDKSLTQVIKDKGALPNTLIAKTGNNGAHYYYRYNSSINNSSSIFGPGLDVKSDGGYVVAPPSVNQGGSYDWANMTDVHQPPTWMAAKKKSSSILTPDLFISGNRNNALTKLAGTLRRKGFNEESIYRMLLEANQTQCSPPLEEGEVAHIAKSIMRYQNLPVDEAFEMVSLKDLIEKPIPAKEWVVDKLLPKNGMSLFVGKPKAGKSTLARQMLFNISRGMPFLGRATKKTLCYYICLEDEDIEIKEHFVNMGATGVEPIKIFSGMAPEDVYKRLSELADREHPGLILIDTLARLVRIQDMNNYAEVTAKLSPYLKFARDGRGHVCFIHHANKMHELDINSPSGSNAFTGTVDTIMLLGRSPNNYRIFKTYQRSGQEIDTSMLIGNHLTGRLELGKVPDVSI